MTIQTNTNDRKALANAIAAVLGATVRYTGVPACSYVVGDYTVDRQGNIIGEDFTPLHDFLVANGYIAAENAGAGSEEPPEENTGTENVAADSGAAEPTPAENTSGIGEQTITIPTPDITVEQLRNLTYILYSRQHILNLMAGGHTIQIPKALIESLSESLPYTREDFTMLLDNFREQGLKGFDFRDCQFTMTFPFYETEPTRWTAFAGLQGRILQLALAATRVFPELIQPDQEAEKYTAHMWLQRLGYRGPEMKEQRNILLKHLHGYCAFSNGSKMQKHKDRFSAIRRERREAERAVADAVAAEEVTGND